MRLYDTARRAVVPFEPGPLVKMYTCGITPYDATHVGHAATFVWSDVAVRPNSGYVPQIITSRSGAAYGSGRSSTPLTTEKIAVVPPIPSPSVSNATSVKPGARPNDRSA